MKSAPKNGSKFSNHVWNSLTHASKCCEAKTTKECVLSHKTNKPAKLKTFTLTYGRINSHQCLTLHECKKTRQRSKKKPIVFSFFFLPKSSATPQINYKWQKTVARVIEEIFEAWKFFITHPFWVKQIQGLPFDFSGKYFAWQSCTFSSSNMKQPTVRGKKTKHTPWTPQRRNQSQFSHMWNHQDE